MRVHHLNCGTLRPLGGRLVDGEGSPFRAATMVCHCLLIETDSGLVLVDSGFGRADIEDPARSLGRRFVRMVRPVLDLEQTAAHQVVRLGFAVADVRHVVLTHLDLDHAGGLPDFPHAKVHVLADEYRAAMAPKSYLDKQRYRRHQWAHQPDWATYDTTGEPWFGFDAVHQLDDLSPEILLIPLAGHTRGHAGIAVDTGEGWLLHAGDAYFFHGEVDPRHTRSTPMLRIFQSLMEVDRQARLANQRRLLELASTEGDKVELICAHNAEELRRHQPTAAC